jgi:hypothetical protein
VTDDATGGYEVPEPKLRLTFENRPGLEVVARSVPLGEFLNVVTLAAPLIGGGKLDVAAAAPAVEALFHAFTSVLVSWNLTRNGQPVPTTMEGLHSLDTMFALEVAHAWIDVVGGGIDTPLPAGSPNGGPPPGGYVPMVPSSPGPQS